MSILEEYIINKLKGYTLVMLVQGYPQTGKSTLVWYLMNCLSKTLFGIDWEYEKYCSKSIDEFISAIKKYDGKLLVYEEASKDISIDKFYDDVNHAFNIIMQTQQYKKNLICLVFPFSASVSKRQRYFIKLGLEVEEKINDGETHATLFKPTIYTRSFWTLDENDLRFKWWGKGFVKYSQNDLLLSKSYTDWLIGKKEEILLSTQSDIRQSLERSKIKCSVCGRKVGLTRHNETFFCNLHKPLIEKKVEAKQTVMEKINENLKKDFDNENIKIDTIIVKEN